jgi:hypothetical protein
MKCKISKIASGLRVEPLTTDLRSTTPNGSQSRLPIQPIKPSPIVCNIRKFSISKGTKQSEKSFRVKDGSFQSFMRSPARNKIKDSDLKIKRRKKSFDLFTHKSQTANVIDHCSSKGKSNPEEEIEFLKTEVLDYFIGHR